MSCETDLTAIKNNTASTASKLDDVVTAVGNISVSGGGTDMTTTEAYLHDVVLLLGSLHMQVTGGLPDGLQTLGGA